MNVVFADTSYWIALASSDDSLHENARRAAAGLQKATLVTTDAVLTEFLNYFSAQGPLARRLISSLVRQTLDNPRIETVETHRESFLAGLALYEQRQDKGYSLTDCISMQVMRERGITQILTHDHHFTQEGFIILL